MQRQRKDGSQVWVELVSRAQRSSEGWMIVTVVRDITARKKAEEGLKLFRALIDQSNDAIEVIDPDTFRFLDVNQKDCLDLGYSREEMLSLTVFDIDPTYDQSTRMERVQDLKKSRSSIAESRHRRKDGSEFPVELSLRYIQLDRYYVLSIARDITERKQIEQALRVSEEKFAKVFHSSPMFVSISTVAEGRYIDVNEGFLRGTGHTREEVIGHTSLEIALWKNRQDRQRAIDSLIKNGRLSGFEAELCKKSGESMTCEIWTEQIVIEDKPCVIWVTNDVTERKRGERLVRDSERRFRAIFDQAPIAMALLDKQGHPIVSNSTLSQMVGYSSDELSKMAFSDFTYPEDIDKDLNKFNELLEGKLSTYRMEKRYVHKNGHLIWANLFVTILPNENGLPPDVLGMAEDITERKTAQDALRQSEVQLRGILESTGEGILAVDRKGKVIRANRRFAEHWGIPKPLLDSRDKQAPLDFCASQLNDAEAFVNKVHGLYASDVEDMDTLTCKDGRVFESHSSPLTLDGTIVGRVWSFRDTTERKHMEERLQKLSHAVEQSPAATAITDTHGRFEYVNPKFLEVTGFTREELVGETPALIKSGLTLPDVYEDLWRTILSGREWRGEIQNRRKSGELYWEYEIISPLKNEHGEIVNFIAVKEDITERKRVVESLRDSEQELRAIFEGALDGIGVADAKTRKYLTANAAMCSMLGYTLEEIVRIGVSDVHPEQDLPHVIAQFERVLRHEIQMATGIPVMRKDGSVFYADIKASTIRFAGKDCLLGIFRDVTESKRAEEALQQEHASLLETQQELLNAHESLAKADRLESVGRLAAGVAHEVKNPLTIIRLGTDYLAKQFPQEGSQEVLDDIRGAIDRAEHVIRDLLEFSRQKPVARRPTYIDKVIDDALRLVKHETERREIVIIRNRDDAMPPIYADPERLVQVFINLLSNAAQAIGRNGSIEIVERSIRLSEQDLERAGTSMLKIGEPVITVDIRDNGPGISAEHENKLFEPFFTTKPQGEGSGLGLAVARNIVIMHEGSISISNRPEGGASALLMFRVA